MKAHELSVELKPINDGNVIREWDDFLKAHQQASFWYSSRWLRYQRAYAAERLIVDASVLIRVDGRCAAIAPLFVEATTRADVRSVTLSIAGGFAPAPLAAAGIAGSHWRSALEAYLVHLTTLAAQHGAVAARLVVPVPASERRFRFREQAWLDTSSETAVLALGVPQEILWSRVRGSYRPLINRGRREFERVVVDAHTSEADAWAAHESYREMHHRAAGRVTRAPESFGIQFEMLRADEASLVGVRHAGGWVGFAYCFHAGSNAYYGSAADEPAYSGPPGLGHALIWTAAEYYRDRGFQNLDLGLQQFGPQLLDIPSTKDIGISFFKRGFGAAIVPLERGVRYFNADAMRQELETWARDAASATP